MQSTDHEQEFGAESRRFRWRSNIALIAFLAIAAFYLIAEHRAHLFSYLPFLLLLVCPLLHIFMHGRHGGHRHDRRSRTSLDGEQPAKTAESDTPLSITRHHQH